MKKYWTIYETALKDALQHRLPMIIYIINDFITPFIAILLWIGVYHFSSTLKSGLSLPYLITYYFVVTFFVLTITQHPELSVGNEDISQGRLSRLLLKPFSYFSYIIVSSSGWKTIRIAASIIPFLGLMYFFRDYIDIRTTQQRMLSSAMFAIIGYFIIFYSKLIIGLSAFWVEEHWGIVHLFWALETLFSGFFLPFDMLPPFLQSISLFLPFRFFYYIPTRYFLSDQNPSSVLLDVSIGTLWVGLLVIISHLLFRRGLLRFTDTRS